MADTSEGGCVRRASTGSAVTRFQALASATISAGMGRRPARMRVRASSTVIIAGAGMADSRLAASSQSLAACGHSIAYRAYGHRTTAALVTVGKTPPTCRRLYAQ